jgi:outer membrane receptor for ferrienterochelin and colicins
MLAWRRAVARFSARAMPLLCLVAKRPAFAQPVQHATNVASPNKEPENVVVTGTRTPENSQRSTVKTDVVTREEAMRRGATNVADALSSQPGVQVNPGAYGFLGGVSAIQIQGFDLNRVLILEDGEPVVGDIGGAIDLAAIPIGDVKRIEIVTGPTSALYGSSAIGGVVNVLTAPPLLQGASGRTRVEGRSRRGAVLQGNASYRSGATWAGIDGNFTRQDGIGRLPIPDLQIPESSRFMLGARAGTSVTDKIDVRVRGRWFRDTSDGLSSRIAPGVGRYLIDQPAETHRFTLHLIQTIDLGRGSNLRLTAGRQWIDTQTSKTQRGSQVGDLRDRSQTMQSFEGILTLANGPRTWVLGARAQVEDFTQTITKTESLARGLVSSTQQEVLPQRYGSVAPYAQLQWKFGEKFTVLPGVRAEVHSRYGRAVTPRLAIAVKPVNEIIVRASVGRGYRAPSAKELGFTFDHSLFGYRVLGAPDLRPETSWGTNADITYQPSSKGRIRAGAFMNWVDDLIDLDLASGSGGSTVVDYQYKNFGKARTFGAQLDGFVQIAPSLRAEFSYDYLWTRDDLNDRPLGGRPPHTVTAAVRATPFWKLEGYARLRVVADAFVSTELRTPGYAMVDLRIGRELWPKSQAYAGVLNLLDTHQQAGRVGDLRPPLGRVFYVGLSAEFPWEDD